MVLESHVVLKYFSDALEISQTTALCYFMIGCRPSERHFLSSLGRREEQALRRQSTLYCEYV